MLNNSFDYEKLLRKYKVIKRLLMLNRPNCIEKKVAVLGGSTTADVIKMLELFLLRNGIYVEDMYENDYGTFWEEAVYGNCDLEEYAPDVVYIHTSIRNIMRFPTPGDSEKSVNLLLEAEYKRFVQVWESLREKYNCVVIQNNFEYPFYRVMGNAEASFVSGKINFITRLNLKFYEYAQKNKGFYINDINYLSANYGLEKWSEPRYWHMYKYALASGAIPYLAQSVANIIKSIYGKNKKAFALDLDNTLWGGVVGDDGADKIEIGDKTPQGQAFAEFQSYLKEHKQIGVLLNVISKNDEENALAGLAHSVLKAEDFTLIKANWETKSQNLANIAEEISLLPESFVFVDDNPAEREIIRQQFIGEELELSTEVAIPEIDPNQPENYINLIDKNGYFEVTSLEADDVNRVEMYRKNAERFKTQSEFADYNDYLKSLEMTSEIHQFRTMHMTRITQLTNKSNQFNLTTKRYTFEEIEKIAYDENYLTLYGTLTDKFGANGVVSVVIGEIKQETNSKELHIILWLMSCRVLKRNMEFAMMDEVFNKCKQLGIKKVVGYYYQSPKNSMVKDFYKEMGFTQISENVLENGINTVWERDVQGYVPKQNVIKVDNTKKKST
jgi:FkbH-like protein